MQMIFLRRQVALILYILPIPCFQKAGFAIAEVFHSASACKSLSASDEIHPFEQTGLKAIDTSSALSAVLCQISFAGNPDLDIILPNLYYPPQNGIVNKYFTFCIHGC